MNDKIEQMIGEIHDMLIEHMHESAAALILSRVRDLAEEAHQDGYELGSEETVDALSTSEYDV